VPVPKEGVPEIKELPKAGPGNGPTTLPPAARVGAHATLTYYQRIERLPLAQVVANARKALEKMNHPVAQPVQARPGGGSVLGVINNSMAPAPGLVATPPPPQAPAPATPAAPAPPVAPVPAANTTPPAQVPVITTPTTPVSVYPAAPAQVPVITTAPAPTPVQGAVGGERVLYTTGVVWNGNQKVNVTAPGLANSGATLYPPVGGNPYAVQRTTYLAPATLGAPQTSGTVAQPQWQTAAPRPVN
jgi:hypothetical protein